MKNQALIKDEKTTLTVGYIAPGWPLSDYPNGIVAYVEYIIFGMGKKAKTFVLARVFGGTHAFNNVIDLSSFNIAENPLQNLLDKILKILFKLNLPYAESILYKRNASYLAKNNSLAILSADPPLDIVEAEESFGFSGFLIKETKVPVIIRLHGPHFTMLSIMKLKNDTDYKLRVFYEGEAIKNAQGVTSPSLDVLDKVRQYYGLSLPNATVIPNPVPSVDEKKRWKLNTTKIPSVLFVGRFDLHKGGDLILQAFRLIALKNNEIVLLFVGPDNGVHHNGETIKFNEYLHQFIPEESVKKRIQFLGHCDSKAIAELRMNSLVTVFPSRYETFGISLLEALATGCPTVATAVGGIKEIIIDNYNGLFAEPDSPQSIADKVLELIDNPEKMQFLSKNAIEDCTKRFSPEVVATQTLAYYQSVLKRM